MPTLIFSAEDVCPYLEFEQDEGPELPEPRPTETEGLPVCPVSAAQYLTVLPDVIAELTRGTEFCRGIGWRESGKWNPEAEDSPRRLAAVL